MRYLAAAAILLAVACASPTAPHKFVPTANHESVGDPCTDIYGRSGYIVYAGDKLVCQ